MVNYVESWFHNVRHTEALKDDITAPLYREPSSSPGGSPSSELGQEFFHDLHLAIRVGLSIGPVLIGKARFTASYLSRASELRASRSRKRM